MEQPTSSYEVYDYTTSGYGPVESIYVLYIQYTLLYNIFIYF
jgi:hypothetical protein